MGRPKLISDSDFLQIAKSVFEEMGHSASTRDVAKAAGISQSVLYKRYKSKDELFIAAMMPPSPDIDKIIGLYDPKIEVETHLYNITLRILKYFSEITPSILQLVTYPSFKKEILTHAHDHILSSKLIKALAEYLSELQNKKLISEVSTKSTAEIFIASIHSIAMFNVFSGLSYHQVDEEWLKNFISVIWKGLKPE